ncbi:MAG TPA: ferritin-like domain-containing protein [Gemmatimonadales bacterium]|nr:ferritin-like domain-containing protein [Gemmatimonadales bacterium]
MALESLRELLARELMDLFGAETQLLKALPNMAKAAATPGLKQALERHLTETEGQVARLEQCFGLLGLTVRGSQCKGMEGLIAEANEMMDEEGPDPVVDAGLIGSAQRVEHYEIAAYGSAVAFAELLGETQVAGLLRQTLDEEQAADRVLTGLARGEVNETALAAGTRITES